MNVWVAACALGFRWCINTIWVLNGWNITCILRFRIAFSIENWWRLSKLWQELLKRVRLVLSRFQEPVLTYLSSIPRAIERHTTLRVMSLRKQRLTSSGSFFGWKWETQELSKHHRGHKMGVVGTPHDGNLITRCFGAYFDFTQLHCRKVLTGETVSQWSNWLTSELRLKVNISLFGNVCNM